MKVKINVYTSKTCQYCEQIKEKLKESSIEFTEIDIVEYKNVWNNVKNLTGIPTTPTVESDNEFLEELYNLNSEVSQLVADAHKQKKDKTRQAFAERKRKIEELNKVLNTPQGKVLRNNDPKLEKSLKSIDDLLERQKNEDIILAENFYTNLKNSKDENKRLRESTGSALFTLGVPNYEVAKREFLKLIKDPNFNYTDKEILTQYGIETEEKWLAQREEDLQRYVEEPSVLHPLIREIWAEGGFPSFSNFHGEGEQGIRYYKESPFNKSPEQIIEIEEEFKIPRPGIMDNKRYDPIVFSEDIQEEPIISNLESKNITNMERGVDRRVKLRGNGVQPMYNRVGWYMRWMSSNKRLADRYPPLRRVYNLIKQYNEDWFSIIQRGIEGRTLALNLPIGPVKEEYRRLRTIADDLGVNIEFSGSSEVAPAGTRATIPIDREQIAKSSPYANPYRNVANRLKPTEEELNQGEVFTEDPLIVNALFQEQSTAKSFWENVIHSFMDNLIFRLQAAADDAFPKSTPVNMAQTIKSYEDVILEEREQTREDLVFPERENLFIDALKRYIEKGEKEKRDAGSTSLAGLVDIMKNNLTVMEELVQGGRDGFFPRVRNGDIIIRVFQTFKENGKNVRRVIFRRDVTAPFWVTSNRKIGWAADKYKQDLADFYSRNIQDFNTQKDITISFANGPLSQQDEIQNLSAIESIFLMQARLNQEHRGGSIFWEGRLEDDEGNIIGKPATNPEEYIKIKNPRKLYNQNEVIKILQEDKENG